MHGTPVSEAGFDHLLSSFRESAFRLECQDAYALDYEAADYELWRDGRPVPPPQVDWWRPWLDWISEITSEGRTVQRVRIAAEPPSEYQRWEMWAAPWHARAGEQIAWLPRSTAREAGLPDADDWWLLDDERLIVTRFSAEGRIAAKTLITEPEILARYRTWREVALGHAVPAEAIAAA